MNIAPYQAKLAPAVIPDTSLFLEISSLEPPHQQTSAPPCVSQLPILDDWSNRSWGFATQDATNAKVVFRVFSALASEDDGLVGTAIALLSSLRRVLGPGRESLIRHHTIPLLGRLGDFVGTVTFTCMVARVRETLRPPPTVPQRLERPRSTLIGAHRGRSIMPLSLPFNIRLLCNFNGRSRSERKATHELANGGKHASGTPTRRIDSLAQQFPLVSLTRCL